MATDAPSPVSKVWRPRRAIVHVALLLVLIALGVGLVFLVPDRQQPADLAEAPGNFIIHESPRALPQIRFADGEGTPVGLSDFHGRTILLNIWATWCAPCREEMPTLDRLQQRLGGDRFEVVVLSVDRAGVRVVRGFFDEIGIEHLGIYIDEDMSLLRELAIYGLPATILIDPAGKEIGRLVGPAEWDTPEMVAFLETIVNGYQVED